MNISSEIFPTDGSNFSDDSFYNDTDVNVTIGLIVDIITIVLGVPINSYVIWLIVRGTGNGIAAEFFSLNLSVCELFFCLTYGFTFFSNSVVLSLVSLFGQGLAITGFPLFQCLMCVERYLAVVHPVTFLKFKPLRYRVICSIIAWTVIFVACGFSTFFIFSLNFYFFFGFILAQFLLFLSIQLFCCMAVLRALKQSGPGERGREREEENHMKKRAFNIILIITVTMVIIYAPTIISGFLFFTKFHDSRLAMSIGRTSFLLGSLVQPFLFIHRVGKLPFPSSCIKC